MLLSENVAKVCTSPRNLNWFTRLVLLMRGWGLGTTLRGEPVILCVLLITSLYQWTWLIDSSHNNYPLLFFTSSDSSCAWAQENLSCTIFECMPKLSILDMLHWCTAAYHSTYQAEKIVVLKFFLNWLKYNCFLSICSHSNTSYWRSRNVTQLQLAIWWEMLLA